MVVEIPTTIRRMLAGLSMYRRMGSQVKGFWVVTLCKCADEPSIGDPLMFVDSQGIPNRPTVLN